MPGFVSADIVIGRVDRVSITVADLRRDDPVHTLKSGLDAPKTASCKSCYLAHTALSRKLRPSYRASAPRMEQLDGVSVGRAASVTRIRGRKLFLG